MFPFVFICIWLVIFAPAIGVLAATLSAIAVGVLWALVWFVVDVIDIWRYPSRDRGDSDLWKYI